jgi:hypothetical protein
MMRFFILLLTVAVLFMNHALGGETNANRNWQLGKVLDSERSQQFAGAVDRPGIVINGKRWTNDSKRAVYQTQQTFVIESETHTYTVSEPLGRREKPTNLTINGPVRFEVVGTSLYLLDDDFKEHKTEILKKALRTPEQSQAPKP